MPTISLFYGILVAMMYEDQHRHALPHIHARYSGRKCVISISDARVLAGEFPPKQLKILQVWVEIHREDLLANWELAVAGEPLFRIPPLS